MKEIKDYTFRVTIETLITSFDYINQIVETKMTKQVGDAFLAQLHDQSTPEYEQGKAFEQMHICRNQYTHAVLIANYTDGDSEIVGGFQYMNRNRDEDKRREGVIEWKERSKKFL